MENKEIDHARLVNYVSEKRLEQQAERKLIGLNNKTFLILQQRNFKKMVEKLSSR